MFVLLRVPAHLSYMTNNSASNRASSRNRKRGKFADEIRQPSQHSLDDVVQEDGVISEEDLHLLNQARLREQFAVELTQAATDGHLDVEFPAGVRNYGSTSDRRVEGVAGLGEVVHYFDIANQNQAPRRIVASRIPDSKYGWGKGEYILQDVETGDISASDLRQHGWTFVEAENTVSHFDENGNPCGYCNSCGEEATPDFECCDDGEIVPYDNDPNTNW